MLVFVCVSVVGWSMDVGDVQLAAILGSVCALFLKGCPRLWRKRGTRHRYDYAESQVLMAI